MMSKKDILFLDANILFSAAYQDKSGLLRFWSIPNVQLISSPYAYEEAERNLKRPHQIKQLKKLMKKVKLINNTHDDKIIPDDVILAAKDRPILASAISGKATHLITGDYKDFGRYFNQSIVGVLIIPPAEFLALNNKLKSS